MVKLTAFKSTTSQQEGKKSSAMQFIKSINHLRARLLDEMSGVISVPCSTDDTAIRSQ